MLIISPKLIISLRLIISFRLIFSFRLIISVRPIFCLRLIISVRPFKLLFFLCISYRAVSTKPRISACQGVYREQRAVPQDKEAANLSSS